MLPLKSFYLEKEIEFTTALLNPKWLKNYNIKDDGILAFLGPAHIKVPALTKEKPATEINCKKMLHFIVQYQKINTQTLLLLQHQLLNSIINYLGPTYTKHQNKIYFLNLPISVSMLKYSKSTSLIYVGLYIDSTGLNFHVLDLHKLNISPKELALQVSQFYTKEVNEIWAKEKEIIKI